jgi:hypothetical protein
MVSDERVLETFKRFGRDNVVWILGFIPIVLAGIRLLTVSRGDSEVFLYLLQDLSVVQLILATVIPLVPLAAFWAWIAWIDWQGRTPRARQVEILPDWVDIPIFIALAGIMLLMPVIQMIANVAILLIFWVIRRYRAKKYAPRLGSDRRQWEDPISWDFRGYVLSVVVTSMTAATVIWIPPESIKVKGADNPQTGIVLSYDSQWTTFLDRNKKINILNSSEIESRAACTADSSWVLKPIGRVFADSPNPPCPSESESKPDAQHLPYPQDLKIGPRASFPSK